MPELSSDQWLFVLMGAILVVLIVNAGVLAYALSGGRVGNGTTDDGEAKPHPTLVWLSKEPAMIAGSVGASAALVAAFGFEMSAEQVGAIIAFLSILLGIFVRQRVTPVAKLEDKTTEVRLTSDR